MNRSTIGWVIVLVSVVFEVMWVIGLKHADSPLEWAVTIIAITISFIGMLAANERLPVGTVYAVFTGLGAAGVVCLEIVLFDEPVNMTKLVLIAILLIGVVGLKMVTDEKEQKGESA